MAIVKIGNEQVEIDILDLDFLSKFESGVTDEIPKKINALQKSEHKSTSAILIEIGRTLVDLFDSLFGDGFSSRAYDGHSNLRIIVQDYVALMNAVSADFAPSAKEMAQLFGDLPRPNPQPDKVAPMSMFR